MISGRSFLFPFKYSHKVAYVIEFSHRKLRVLSPEGLIVQDDCKWEIMYPGSSVTVTGSGTEITISGVQPLANGDISTLPVLPEFVMADQWTLITPYTLDDLWDYDELCCKIQTIQHSDVLYIFSENHPIKVLKRYSNTNWALEDLELKNGPFLAMNTGETTVSSNGVIGTVTLTSSADLFKVTDEGRLMRLRLYDDDTKPWSAGVSVGVSEVRRSDNKYYRAVNAGTTGTIKPVHSEGARSDGSVKWTYLHDGAGIVKIKTCIDAKHVMAEVIARLPDSIESGTACWEMGMLHKGDNYPKSGAFFRNRFAFMVNTATGPNVCLSMSGDYNNFADMEFGEATAETAITVPVLNTEFNEGKWLYAGDVLFVGTGSAEFYIDAVSAANPMAADNVKISQISSVGSKAVMPVGLGAHVFFTDRYGLSLRDLTYNYYNDGYDQVDMSLLGKHLFSSRIVAMCYQEIPDKILWCLVGDGSLTALTFSAEQEVAALSRHDFSGTVESLAVIPNMAVCHDQLWLETKRVANGTTVRTIEYADNGMPQFGPSSVYNAGSHTVRRALECAYVRYQAMYLDAAVVFERESGDETTEISGLSHLEGLQVALFADGAVLPDQIVVDGKVSIKPTYARVVVGLRVMSQYVPQNIYIPEENGSGIGQSQRINHVLLVLYMSGGGKIGEDENSLSEILYRPANAEMDEPQALFSGNKEVLFNGATSRSEQSAALMIENDSPLPMNVLAIVPSMDV